MTPDEMLAAIRIVVVQHDEMGLDPEEAIDAIISIIRDRDE